MKKAVFLDKDGTIIENVPYNIDQKKISILPKTIEGLRLLQGKGYRLIIITNQSGIAKGIFSEYACIKHMHAIINMFLQHGIYISSYYYCPHDKVDTEMGLKRICWCGKPNPGMIFHAAKDFSIDLSTSWMIGDILNDIEAGKRAQTRTILMDVGNETEWVGGMLRKPDFIASDFLHAAQFILEKDL